MRRANRAAHIVFVVCAVTIGMTTVVAGAAPEASADVATAPARSFVRLPFARLLDTRSGIGGPTAAVAAGRTLPVQLLGHGGVPSSDVSAVVLSVTVATPKSAGHLAVYADGTARPNAASVAFPAGTTRANIVIAQVGANGKADFFNSSPGSAQLIADVYGYYTSGDPAGAAGSASPLHPARLLDTRLGTGAKKAPLAARGTVTVQVGGRGGVPSSGVSAVAVTITALSPTASGYLIARPSGATASPASINFVRGQAAMSNLLILPMNANGQITIVNSSSGSVHVSADVSAYYTAGPPSTDGTLGSLASTRVLDTRHAIGAPAKAVPPGGTVEFQVVGKAGVPADGVAAVLLNVAVITPSVSGYAAAASGQSPGDPTINFIDFAKGQTTQDTTLAPVLKDGTVILTNRSSAPVHLLADVGAYMLDQAPGAVSEFTVSYSGTTYVSLMWSSPWDERYASVTIRRAKGSVPPDTPTSGGYVPPTGDDAYLTPGTLYSYTVFPHNARGSYGPSATLQITTSTAGGTVTRVAGGSADAGEPPHACGDGGPALDACLENANDVAADGAGNVYVADGLAGVRKINTSGVITTVAGHSGCADGLTGDGKQATAACVSAAQVAVAPDGTVYVADHSVNSAINNPVVIRKIDTSGVITTFAGKDPYVYAYDLAVDQDGNVYVAGGNVVVRVTPAGAVTPIAGNDWNPRGLCADGAPAVGDCLSNAESVAVDPQGNVLIGDPGNRRIFEVSDGKIRTVAGIGTWGFCGDGGPATAACINDPLGLAFDRSGNLLIADGENRIRKLVLGGALTTIAGTGGRSLQPCADTSPALDPCLDEIRSIAVDPQDHIYLSDMQLRRIAELHSA